MKNLFFLLLLLGTLACEQENIAPNSMEQAHQRIGGSKLIIASVGSIISSYNVSSWTELDFCPNGYFVDFSESYVHVEGSSRNPNTGQPTITATSANASNATGAWGIMEIQGQPALVLQYQNGSTVTYSLEDVMSGSWEQGRFRFAMDWGKGQCR